MTAVTPERGEGLKPCPFCGADSGQEEAVAVTRFKSPVGGTALRVVCCCGATGKASWDYLEAIAAWNTRPAPSPATDEMVGVLRWYGEQARLARLIHSEGDAGRHALAADGGERARSLLAKLEVRG